MPAMDATRGIALPESDDDILSHLLVISRVRPGEKLTICPFSVCPGGLANAPFRWWHGEGRKKTLAYLQSLLATALTRLEALRDSASPSGMTQGYARQFHARINGALTGLSALIVTYGADQVIASQLETLQQGADIRMQGLAGPPARATTPPERT